MKNQKYYSTAFIKEFGPRFNKYYIYNHSANKIRNTWLIKYYKPGNIGHQNALTKFENEFL